MNLSLLRHGEVQALLGGDQMIEIDCILIDVDLDPVHFPAEFFLVRVVIGHG